VTKAEKEEVKEVEIVAEINEKAGDIEVILRAADRDLIVDQRASRNLRKNLFRNPIPSQNLRKEINQNHHILGKMIKSVVFIKDLLIL